MIAATIIIALLVVGAAVAIHRHKHRADNWPNRRRDINARWGQIINDRQP